MNKSAVKEITDALHSNEVCEALGVKERSVRAARQAGVFPSSWYVQIKSMCDAVGIDCPESAFSFKVSADR